MLDLILANMYLIWGQDGEVALWGAVKTVVESEALLCFVQL